MPVDSCSGSSTYSRQLAADSHIHRLTALAKLQINYIFSNYMRWPARPAQQTQECLHIMWHGLSHDKADRLPHPQVADTTRRPTGLSSSKGWHPDDTHRICIFMSCLVSLVLSPTSLHLQRYGKCRHVQHARTHANPKQFPPSPPKHSAQGSFQSTVLCKPLIAVSKCGTCTKTLL